MFETLWDIHTGELKWARSKDSNFIIEFKNGLEAATFTVNDFMLTGCDPFDNFSKEADKKLPDNNRKQPKGRKILRKLAKEAKRAARQARRAAKKAEVASKKIEEALQNKKRQ